MTHHWVVAWASIRRVAAYRLVANGLGDVDLEKLDAAEFEPAL